MTDPELILRQLIIEGHEGASLLAAFGRWVRALNGAGAAAQLTVPAKMNKVATSGHVNVAKAQPERVAITAPPENGKALARKAIAQSMLAPSTIAVGSHLVERFNLATGRCDPGYGSIAADLGISVRTARRAVASLVGAGLFGRVRHGGLGHRNAYQPNWPVIIERAGEGDIAATGTTVSIKGANSVPQNHLRKPDSDSMSEKPQRRRAAREPDRRQGVLMMPIGGGREKAEQAVRSKLNTQLNAHLVPMGKAAVVEGHTRSMSVDWGPAISAEMHRTGEGLPVLLEAIDALGDARVGLGGSGR